MTATNAELASYHDFAHALADEAGLRLSRWFGRATAALKSDGSFVTEADLEVDRFIHQAVASSYPSHGMLTEESSLVYDGAEFTWVVDPLDGTNNFANGLPLWGCSIALLRQGQPLLAVLDFPPIGQRYSAVHGCGALWNGQPLRVPTPVEPHGNDFFFLDSRGFRLLEYRVQPKARLLGCAAYDLAAVSSGAAVACCELLPKIWDIAGAWLVLSEAGATVAPLLSGATVFPMQVGMDYTERVFPLLAAANPVIWQAMQAGIHVKPSSRRLIDRLQEQGWVVDL
ncbi:MAG TPA: inositol monophosphatase family protein [Anaerolineae bacterium]|nr:inositol monophosphatase family protein [Anaerolineae bacterium]